MFINYNHEFLIIITNFGEIGVLQYYGRKYCTKLLDDKKKTCDSGITTIFKVTNVSHRSDIHLITYELR
jgi:hypothetical protein